MKRTVRFVRSRSLFSYQKKIFVNKLNSLVQFLSIFRWKIWSGPYDIILGYLSARTWQWIRSDSSRRWSVKWGWEFRLPSKWLQKSKKSQHMGYRPTWSYATQWWRSRILRKHNEPNGKRVWHEFRNLQRLGHKIYNRNWKKKHLWFSRISYFKLLWWFKIIKYNL